jgi:hypothetical protein
MHHNTLHSEIWQPTTLPKGLAPARESELSSHVARVDTRDIAGE